MIAVDLRAGTSSVPPRLPSIKIACADNRNTDGEQPEQLYIALRSLDRRSDRVIREVPRVGRGLRHANSLSKAFACFRSSVSNPSVNQP